MRALYSIRHPVQRSCSLIFFFRSQYFALESCQLTIRFAKNIFTMSYMTLHIKCTFTYIIIFFRIFTDCEILAVILINFIAIKNLITI